MATAARPRVVAGLRLLEVVGNGAEGEVWEARDARGRRRALKLIRPGALVEPDEVRRRGSWLVEVEHPALARVWRTGVLAGGGLDGWGFVEMDFVDGVSLQRAPADPDALARLGPLAEALDLLHTGAWSDGVPLVHRDVKPANLIRRADGRGLVLVDHSTLRAAGGDTVTRIGTPLFAAPEVITGRMGPPADVYSFCATVVALLTGARGDALAAVLDRLDTLDLPEGVRAGLREDPARRPRSCRLALASTVRIADDPPLAAPGAAHERPDATARAHEEPTVALPWPADPQPTVALDRSDGGVRERTAVLGTHGAGVREADLDAGGFDGAGVGHGRADDGGGYGPDEDDGGYGRADDGGWSEAPEGGGFPEGAHAGRPASAAGLAAWLAVLALCAAVPALAALAGVPRWPDAVAWCTGALGVHVLAHQVAGRSSVGALLAPPIAWGLLLADRAVAPGRVRDWARALLVGAASLLAVAVALSLWLLAGTTGPTPALAWAPPPAPVDATAAGVLVAAGVGLVVLAVVAVRRGGALLRVLLLPPWLLGAALLVLGGLPLLPLALLAGRGGALLRLQARTVAGAAALVRPARAVA